MASIHATNPLITHTFTGKNTPAEGTLIRLRIDISLQGPGSMEPSTRTSFTESSNKSPMHSALVLSVSTQFSPDGRRILQIECFPIVSLHRSDDPVRVIARTEGFQNFVHVPIPSTASVPTPELFGNPLVAGGYINDCACWIQARREKVTLKEGQKWKSFRPEITFSNEEIVHLVQYEQELLTHFFPSELPSYGIFLNDHLDFTPDGDSFDEDEDDEPLYESPADFFRVFDKGPRDKQMEWVIRQDDAHKSELKIARVREWIGELASFGKDDWQE